MTTFEGPVKAIPHGSDVVFGFLSDFNNFEALLPPDKISNWESDGDSCRFTVDGIGELGLRIIEKIPYKTIKFTADGKTPFDFFLWVQLKETGVGDSRVKLTIKAELNPMLKMVVTGPVNKFLTLVTEGIAAHPYSVKA
jgi:carbon monoxide dehydrogenase subunit G